MGRKRKQPNGSAHVQQSNGQANKKQKLDVRARSEKDYSSANLDFAVLFEGLSSEDVSHRDQASIAFVEKAESILTSGSSDPLALFLDLRQPRNVYVRLIKGTCTNAKQSRAGFSDALQKLLLQRVFPAELRPSLLKLIADNTQPGQDALRSEKRECLIGRMTAYRAALLSGLYTPKSTNERISEFETLIHLMCDLVEQAPHVLREICGQSLCIAIDKSADSPASEDIYAIILNCTIRSSFVRSIEGAAVLIQATHRSKAPERLPRGPFGTGIARVVDRDFMQLFIKGHGMSELDEDSEKDVSGRRQATPSFAWEVVLALFAADSITTKVDGSSKKSDQRKKASVASKDALEQKFWLETIDDNFFADKASDNKKSLGFQIFAMVLRHHDWPFRDIWLSPRILQCLQNQCKSASNKVFGPAKTVVLALNARLSAKPEEIPKVLSILTLRGGDFVDFDALTASTGMKVIQNIWKTASNATVGEIFTVLTTETTYNKKVDEATGPKQREGVAGLVLQAIRLRRQQLMESNILEDTWPAMALTTLLLWSCAENKTLATETIKSRFLSSLGELVTSCPAASEFPPQLLIKAEKPVMMSIQILPVIEKTHERALEILKKTQDADAPLAKSYRLLLSMTVLEVYTGDSQAVEILRDLVKAYSKTFVTSEPELGSTDAIVEILVSFASRPSLTRRKLSELLFSAFAAAMSIEALTAVTEVLVQQESVAGQKALFDENGDAEMDDAEDSDVEVVDSDVEEVDGDEMSDSVSESSSDDDEGDADEDEGDEGAAGDERLNAALGTLLRTRPAPKSSTAPEAGDDDSSSDESTMSDNAMLALEPQLAAAFAQHSTRPAASSQAKSNKKETQAARETMLAFKNRLLDMLALWLKAAPAAPLAPHTLLPLVRAVRVTKAPQVAEKSARVLAAYCDAAKKDGTPVAPVCVDTDMEDALLASLEKTPGLKHAARLQGGQRTLFALLAELHAEAAVPRASKRHGGACARASLFVARCLLANAESERERDKLRAAIAYLYTATQLRGGVPPAFVREWVEWDASVAAAARAE